MDRPRPENESLLVKKLFRISEKFLNQKTVLIQA
jgi:hypothetical protein